MWGVAGAPEAEGAEDSATKRTEAGMTKDRRKNYRTTIALRWLRENRPDVLEMAMAEAATKFPYENPPTQNADKSQMPNRCSLCQKLIPRSMLEYHPDDICRCAPKRRKLCIDIAYFVADEQ